MGGANPLAFHSFGASIKFGQEGGGSIKIFRPKFFCLSGESIRKGTL